jgi:lysine-specific demethylase 3
MQTDQDWPPSKDFKDQFPELYSAFCLAIPMPDLTRPDGCFNMAAYFATNALKPDLGESYLAFCKLPMLNCFVQGQRCISPTKIAKV